MPLWPSVSAPSGQGSLQAAPLAVTAKAVWQQIPAAVELWRLPVGHGFGALTESLERVSPAPLYQGGLVAETVVPQLLAVMCPLGAMNPLSVPSVCCSPECEEQAGFLR